jgi:hypothetical protein
MISSQQGLIDELTRNYAGEVIFTKYVKPQSFLIGADLNQEEQFALFRQRSEDEAEEYLSAGVSGAFDDYEVEVDSQIN